MKSSLPLLVLALLGSLAATAQAGTISFITDVNASSGGDGGSVYIPASCAISCYVEITIGGGGSPYGGGGGIQVSNDGGTVIACSAGGIYPGIYTDSDTVYNQPSGAYRYGQGFGGPANTVTSAYLETTFSW